MKTVLDNYPMATSINLSSSNTLTAINESLPSGKDTSESCAIDANDPLNGDAPYNLQKGRSNINTDQQGINLIEINEKGESLHANDDVYKKIKTTCPYCGVGCGVLATVNTQTHEVSVQGDPEHPANFGKLCSKGSNLAQTLGKERRITVPYYQNKQRSMTLNKPNQIATLPSVEMPSIEVEETIQATTWDTVLTDIATRFTNTIETHGRDSIMFYVSGQLLTEDYYVANKFIKGFLGNNNIDSNSRLCMSSAVAGHKRAFGADLVPGSYTDFETCDLLVLVGSNMAWCHPILFGRFLAAKQLNPNKKLVVIDPRRTDSCEFADLHLPIVAGSDTHLFNGLLNYLEHNGYRDADYAAQCDGLEAALLAADAWDIEAVATATQLQPELIEQFYRLVAETGKTVTAFSMGVNQSSSGTDKVNAIINTHLLTGRVGLKGASPFSLTGQPNAMGGREVGALSNLLAGHFDLANPNHRASVTQFWHAPQDISPNIGVTACEAAEAILEGRIKAIWIMATNPVVSLPEADKFRRALAQCDLVIVSECSKDSDTIRCADIVLPAQGWGEKSGTVTNSERRISRQRRLLPATGEAKPDWWMVSQVAKRMGFKGFDYEHPSEIFNEHAALTSYQNDTYPRYFDLLDEIQGIIDIKVCGAVEYNPTQINRSLSLVELSQEIYEEMTPFQWGSRHIKVNQQGFAHGRPRFVAIDPPQNAGEVNSFTPVLSDQPQSQFGYDTSSQSITNKSLTTDPTCKSIALRLITGRLRDQWHTMTRTGLAPKLNEQQSIPTLTLHPEDAAALGVAQHEFISVMPQTPFSSNPAMPISTTTRQAPSETNVVHAHSLIAQVAISDDVRQGDSFMPMHWSEAFANCARVGVVIPTKVDPISYQPELKNSAVRAFALKMHSVGYIMVQPEWLDAILVQLRDLELTESNNLPLELSQNAPVSTIEDNLEHHDPARATPYNVDPELQYNNSVRVNSDVKPPPIVWSISRQKDSVLIHLATPSKSMSNSWLTVEFWNSFVEQTLSMLVLDKSASTSTSAQPIEKDTSVMIDEKNRALRLVVRQKNEQTACLTSDDAGSNYLEGSTQTSAATLSDTQSNTQTRTAKLLFAVYTAPDYSQLPSTHWLNQCFASLNDVPSVKWLLAGRPASGYVDPGPTVCACMGVGKNIIINAIEKNNCRDATAVGKVCAAGTNCGSCVAEINNLIKQYA